SVQIDEILLWKCVHLLQTIVAGDQGALPASTSDFTALNTDSRHCFFGILNLAIKKLFLSVLTSSSLPVQLQLVKQQFDFPLVRFENAPVELAPFQQFYYFESFTFLVDAVVKHFARELKSQAVKILGSVDFLGNPLGLFYDVSGGLQELIIEGNVAGFVTGVWHGVSNSAAKITNALSEGVGKFSMDEQHRHYRATIRHGNAQNPIGHLMTGFKGLGIGVFGGVTSLLSQMVDGAVNSGLQGLVSGFGKGLVGTVAKPVQGVLDFASGAAAAAKEVVSGSSTLNSRFPPKRLRLPRVIRNLQCALPPYDSDLAEAQQTMLQLKPNSDDSLEKIDDLTPTSHCICRRTNIANASRISVQTQRTFSWLPQNLFRLWKKPNIATLNCQSLKDEATESATTRTLNNLNALITCPPRNTKRNTKQKH
ncbi:unnamed protein product, partial [Soboliphyme baturini]|uniref:VPS13_C domain-containing protein n=1 Tax=Soboliphyme baturini TaxID=241478 RepID=A0A183ILI5_9BILA